MPSVSSTFNKKAKANFNKRSRVVGDYTVRTRESQSGVPGNTVLYNDGSPVIYNDGSFLVYNA